MTSDHAPVQKEARFKGILRSDAIDNALLAAAMVMAFSTVQAYCPPTAPASEWGARIIKEQLTKLMERITKGVIAQAEDAIKTTPGLTGTLPESVQRAVCPPGGGFAGGNENKNCLAIENRDDSINDASIRAAGMKQNHENRKQAEAAAPKISTAQRAGIATYGTAGIGSAREAAVAYGSAIPVGTDGGLFYNQQALTVNTAAGAQPGDYSGEAMGGIARMLATPPIAPPGVSDQSAAAMGLAGSATDPKGILNAERAALLIGSNPLQNLPTGGRDVAPGAQTENYRAFSTRQYLGQVFTYYGSASYGRMLTEMQRNYVNSPAADELDYVMSCKANKEQYGVDSCTNEYALLKYRLKLQQGSAHILLTLQQQQQEELRLKALQASLSQRAVNIINNMAKKK